MSDFSLLESAARGMNAQRTILDITARNVAAAQVATPGEPYARLVARAVERASPDDDPIAAFDTMDTDDETQNDVVVRRETGTGDATTEMIAALDAQRSYEAHASMFDIGKRLAERTLDIIR